MTNPKEALEWYERKRGEARAMADRDCNNCKHQKADGCSRWECEYEPAKNDLISRQDAIEAVATVTMSIHLSSVLCDKLLALPSADEQDNNRLYIRIYVDDEPSRKAEKLYQICGEAESQEVAQWLKEYFLSADRPTEWIPVSERLPEKNGCYLVSTTGENNYIIDIAFYIEGMWHKTSRIKAWMPLPEPYKGGDSE